MDIIKERLELALYRIDDINKNENHIYFKEITDFILTVYKGIDELDKASDKTDVYKRLNDELYRHVKDESYNNSIYNPEYLSGYMRAEEAKIFSGLAYMLLEIYPLLLEDKDEKALRIVELFLQCASIYFTEDEEERIDSLNKTVYYYNFDYLDEDMEDYVNDKFIFGNEYVKDIILNDDLSNTDYLYKFGTYIDNNMIRTAKLVSKMSDEKIKSMSDAVVNGYIRGFEAGGKDLYKNKYIGVFYEKGFERYVRNIIKSFEEKGFIAIVTDQYSSSKRLNLYEQCNFDHMNFESIYIDKAYMDRKLSSLEIAFIKNKDKTVLFAGPLVNESFGKDGFDFKSKECVYKLNDKQNALKSNFNIKYKELYNKYIDYSSRSFSIISWPDANINQDDSIYEEIMNEVLYLNTIDIKEHTKIQQYLIDALDNSDYVVVKGGGNNKTDIRVSLYVLKDKNKETKFENCGADVNIPLGEVFTSPVLKGTTGILNVGKVFIGEIEFKDLNIEFVDGMVKEYSCSNFDDDKENKTLIEKYIFGYNKTLPLGEFAIGTNTRAYSCAKKYNIFNKLPILIAEKTGPHFAVGDTCYNSEEDIITYNPDGKAIVARENEISALRKCPGEKAYFGTHVDITIPYDELGDIYGVNSENEKIYIIKDGKFILEGTEKLNEFL